MNDTSALNNIPKRTIKPHDGMPVTADTWMQAHDEHRGKIQAHNLFFHGAGIVTGLNVLANDPPDQFVFISPGLAVDQVGKLIILNEPVAYDFGDSMEGELYLLIGHGEREISSEQDDIRYIQSEFIIAARPSLPKRPAVELARVVVKKGLAGIKNAADPVHPELGEIDLRWRQVIERKEKTISRVGILNLGSDAPAGVIAGWDYLARECSRATSFSLVVDQIGQNSEDLNNFDVLYLAGSGAFKLDAGNTRNLAAFIESGKAIIAESMDMAADDSFKPIFGKLNLNLKPVAEYDSILKTPHLFNSPPDGNQDNKVLIGKGVIYTSAKYALAWSGKVLGGTGSRADIRSALEWGVNMIHYCLHRK